MKTITTKLIILFCAALLVSACQGISHNTQQKEIGSPVHCHKCTYPFKKN